MKGIGFTEMLPRDNGKERKCLKPRIEQVWKVGKVSRFCGPFGYIEGQFGIDGWKCVCFLKSENMWW